MQESVWPGKYWAPPQQSWVTSRAQALSHYWMPGESYDEKECSFEIPVAPIMSSRPPKAPSEPATVVSKPRVKKHLTPHEIDTYEQLEKVQTHLAETYHLVALCCDRHDMLTLCADGADGW
jgi:hypothetical protein